MSISEKFPSNVGNEKMAPCMAELTIQRNGRQMGELYKEIFHLREVARDLYPQADNNYSVLQQLISCFKKMGEQCDSFFNKLQENEKLGEACLKKFELNSDHIDKVRNVKNSVETILSLGPQ